MMSCLVCVCGGGGMRWLDNFSAQSICDFGSFESVCRPGGDQDVGGEDQNASSPHMNQFMDIDVRFSSDDLFVYGFIGVENGGIDVINNNGGCDGGGRAGAGG